MIPLECVFRFVTTGSHYRREKHLLKWEQDPDGTVLNTPIMEFFYKHDVYSSGKRIADPLMELEDGIPKLDDAGNFILLHPSTWEQIKYTDVFHAGTDKALNEDERRKDREVIIQHAEQIKNQTISVWEKLKDFYSEADIEVLDGKIEFWIAPNWKVVVADVIDADSCRLRKPTVIEDSDGNRYLWKEFTKDEVYDSLIQKYFDPIDKLREIQSLIIEDSSPYNDTLDIIEKHCKSEPWKYEDALSDFKWGDWKINFWLFRQHIADGGLFQGTRGITKSILQDTARKKAWELESNYDLEGIFHRNNNERIVFHTYHINEAKTALRQHIDTLNDYDEDVIPSRIVEWEGFDKQWYRDWEDLWATKSKYDKLARITKWLLKKLWIWEVRSGIAGKVVETLL